MKHYPSQSRFLAPKKAEAGWKTRTQKACCPSFRYIEMVPESCHPSAPRQCRSTDTFVLELVHTPAAPAAHTHIPDTSRYRYRFHPHMVHFRIGIIIAWLCGCHWIRYWRSGIICYSLTFIYRSICESNIIIISALIEMTSKNSAFTNSQAFMVWEAQTQPSCASPT